jgi:16S rRNA (guanine527-N7)-methyltransferase
MNALKWKQFLINGSAELGIEILPQTADKFEIHAQELLFWNRKINLTTITNPVDMAVKHFIDSIAPIQFSPKNSVLLDIGTGGGFPGIPLKLQMPSISVTMIDTSRKKISFLNHIISKLNLKNTIALHSRADKVAENTNFKASFDVIVSRALTDLTIFSEMALPLLNNHGFLLAYKGPYHKKTGKERKTLHLKGLPIKSTVFTYRLPYLKIEHTVVKIIPSLQKNIISNETDSI